MPSQIIYPVRIIAINHQSHFSLASLNDLQEGGLHYTNLKQSKSKQIKTNQSIINDD